MDNPPLDREARAAMQAARQAAVDAGAARANALQILIATLDYPRAGALLELFAVDPATVRSGAQFIGAARGVGAIEGDSEERTIELAMAEARALAHAETGIEHVLLGIAGQDYSAAAAILASLNITLPHARRAVRFLHGELRSWEPPENRADADGGLTMTAPLTLDTSEESQQLARDLSQRMSPFMDTEGDRLRRVVGIGQVREQSGVLIELIALEVRELRSILYWRAHCAADRLLGYPSFIVSDDVGTPYDVLPASSSGGGGEFSGELWVSPIASDAGRLIVEISGFGGDFEDFHHPLMPKHEAISGPWRFEISLG